MLLSWTLRELPMGILYTIFEDLPWVPGSEFCNTERRPLQYYRCHTRLQDQNFLEKAAKNYLFLTSYGVACRLQSASSFINTGRSEEWRKVEAWGGTTTEAKGRRELAQQGILPGLAEGERTAGTVLYHLPKVKAAHLRDSGNSSCCCCWYITDRIQPTVIIAISHDRPGYYSSRPMPPWAPLL